MYPNFLKCFPFSSFADSINNFPSPSGPYTSQKRHLKPIHRWCSGTNQSTAWIATWNQPARLPHIPCRPCKAFGTSQTNLLCSRKKQQHEPSHPQWTCCSPQKRTVCVPPCIKSAATPRKNDTLNQYIDRWCSGTNQSTAWIATLKPTCQAAAHPLSTLQRLGNISNQPALQPQEPTTWAFTPSVDML